MQSSNNKKPPGAAVWILRKLTVYRDNYSSIEDFEEEYQENLKTDGRLKAVLRCWIHVINMVRFFLVFKLKWSFIMFKNYLKIALRNIRKHKLYSFINIAGLAIGITCFMLIFLYILYEYSYDEFHEKKDRIYRIIFKKQGHKFIGSNFMATTSGPMAPALKSEFPEVKNATRVGGSYGIFKYKEVSFYTKGIYADEHFFNIFSFQMLQGDPKKILIDPFSMIISEELAEQKFGGEDPVGKTINFNDQYDLTIRVRAAQASLVTDNIKEIIKFMQNEIGGTFKQTQSVFRTTQNDLYNRMRTNFFKSIKTKEIKKYMYSGVLDGKTRDFCRKHIGEIKTEKQWRAIKNDSGTSAWCCRGSWNCRQQILFISELWDKKEVDELQKDMKEQGVIKL